MTKLKIGILCGGKSAEHEVSLQSALNIFKAIDREKYESILISITKEGEWIFGENTELILNTNDPERIKLNPEGKIFNFSNDNIKNFVDVIFPILHGPFGEDGTVQGLLKLIDIPFVGSGVLGSAVGMDKDVMKRLLLEAGISIGRYLCFKQDDVLNFERVKDELGLPLFVKPANMGSSVGVSKVRNEIEYQEAIQKAFLYDTKIIVEKNITGREIECAVLGNNKPIASIPGEIIVRDDFYSYEVKYIDETGSVLKIPAEISREKQERVKELSIKVFKILCSEGMGRVDIFLTGDGELVVNEINTIPGFTKNSMYPKLWEASGISYRDLISELIMLAMERCEKEKKLKSNFNV